MKREEIIQFLTKSNMWDVSRDETDNYKFVNITNKHQVHVLQNCLLVEFVDETTVDYECSKSIGKDIETYSNHLLRTAFPFEKIMTKEDDHDYLHVDRKRDNLNRLSHDTINQIYWKNFVYDEDENDVEIDIVRFKNTLTGVKLNISKHYKNYIELTIDPSNTLIADIYYTENCQTITVSHALEIISKIDDKDIWNSELFDKKDLHTIMKNHGFEEDIRDDLYFFDSNKSRIRISDDFDKDQLTITYELFQVSQKDKFHVNVSHKESADTHEIKKIILNVFDKLKIIGLIN